MKLNKRILLQFIVFIVLVSIFLVLLNNLIVNILRTQIGLSFKWLLQPAGFALSESVLPFNPSNTYLWALCIGWLNSMKVVLSSLILATFIGTLIGMGRISRNRLIYIFSSSYVTFIRQIPLLLQLFFWYFVAFLSLSDIPLGYLGGLIQISNQGLFLLGVKLSVEFSALLIGLSIYTAASIAEIIRGGFTSVDKGQWEAYRSLGLPEKIGLARIIFPQALPAILPGLTSQYLNLAKNSTLAIAIGYADIYAVSDTTITQTGRAIEGFLLLLISFLILNLVISRAMEMVNKRILETVNRS